MAKKQNTFVIEILSILKDLGEMMPMPFETPYGWIRRYSGVPRKKYYNTIHQLKRRGVVEVSQKSATKFIRLTRKGELELLFAKSVSAKIPGAWDGKWRVMMFDIPEPARELRDKFRGLLKKNRFVRIQQSVYISPWELNRAAVDYLRVSGLKKFIRIMRADLLDDDKDLQKIFKLRTYAFEPNSTRSPRPGKARPSRARQKRAFERNVVKLR